MATDLPVVTTQSELLFNSWEHVFQIGSGNWITAVDLKSFDGKDVDEGTGDARARCGSFAGAVGARHTLMMSLFSTEAGSQQLGISGGSHGPELSQGGQAAVRQVPSLVTTHQAAASQPCCCHYCGSV